MCTSHVAFMYLCSDAALLAASGGGAGGGGALGAPPPGLLIGVVFIHVFITVVIVAGALAVVHLRAARLGLPPRLAALQPRIHESIRQVHRQKRWCHSSW